MAYDVTLVQFTGPIPSTTPDILSNVQFGSDSPYDNLLISWWTCNPGSSDPFTNTLFFFDPVFFEVSSSRGITVELFNVHTVKQQIYSANYRAPTHVRWNFLLSVNAASKTVQLYCNDALLSPISGGWTATNSLRGLGQLDIIAGNLGNVFPAVADVWMSLPSTFVDLSIEANRRKFINADLTPVFLGDKGTEPFGTQPPLYLTVPAGGVPNDLLTNYGTGGSFRIGGTGTLTFQAVDTCAVALNVQVQLTGVSATAEVGEFPQFHELKLVSLYPILPSSGDAYGLISDFGADFPTSFGQFSLSVWCCEDVNIRGPNSYATPFSFDMKFTPSAATLQLYDSLNQVLFSGSFTNPHTPTDLYHVMFSIDTQTQTYALWIASGAAAIEWTTSDANFATVGGINNVGA